MENLERRRFVKEKSSPRISEGHPGAIKEFIITYVGDDFVLRDDPIQMGRVNEDPDIEPLCHHRKQIPSRAQQAQG